MSVHEVLSSATSSSSIMESAKLSSSETESMLDGRSETNLQPDENKPDTSISCDGIDMLLIEDSSLERIPVHLQNLLHDFNIEDAQATDLLMALIYGIALECSFASIDEVQKHIEDIESVTRYSAFNKYNVRLLSSMPSSIYDPKNMTYTMRLQLTSDINANVCLLTGIVTGDLFILTVTPSHVNDGGRSVCLSIGRYVLNSKGRPYPSRFRKLPELTFKLRNDVLVPLRNRILKGCCNTYLYPGLDGLPEELYTYLYNHMSIYTLKKVATVSKRMNYSVNYHLKRLRKKII